MLSCKDISNLASDHIDKKLPPLMKMKVKMHLFMCAKCREFVKQLQATVDVLKNLKTPHPEESFVNQQASELLDIAKGLKAEGNNNGPPH